MRLNLASVAGAVGAPLPGGARGDAVITSVTTDSREARPGALFLCLCGERVDGHDFALQAARAGAQAIIATRPLPDVAAALPDVPVLLVDDAVIALGQVAAAWRDTYAGRLIGLTGTAGKTTVKELLASVLSQAGRVARTGRNHNNQIGMPLSLLAADGGEAFWVMEAGISHPQDMDELASVMRPDVALVLNAGSGHTEGLGDRGVAWYKSRIFTYLPENGLAIASADYPELTAETLTVQPGARLFSALADPRACCLAARVASRADGDDYEITCRAPLAPAVFLVSSPLRGQAGAENCAAVALCALSLGLTPEQVQAGIAGATLPGQRFNRVEAGAFRLLDDTYNANPLSMGRMLDACLEEAAGRPIVLMLGEMRELGSLAHACHVELGRHMARLAPELACWKGGERDAVLAGLREGGYAGELVAVSTKDDFAAALDRLSPATRQSGAVMLFKGSRANRLEDMVAAAVERLGADRGGK